MNILLTNIILSGRSGTEIQVRNTALHLARRGHRCVVYSPALGPIAEELRDASIPVIDDIALTRQPVDLIHGHHGPVTATAVARFPHAPAVFVCHSFNSWFDQPPLLPSIRRYIAIDNTVADRLTAQEGIAPAQVRRLFNAVDLERFRPGPPLPQQPRKALAFVKNHGHLAAIERACAARGIAVESVGQALGRLTASPETLVPQFDLVFTSALSAMEAMACGRAVVVCDGRGLAGMATAAQFAEWRGLNFGLRILNRELTAEAIGAEIDRYDARDAAQVAALLRAENGFEGYIPALLAVYQEAIEDHARATPSADDTAAALAAHFQRWAPRIDPAWPWLEERQMLLDRAAGWATAVAPAPLRRRFDFHGTAIRAWCRTLTGFYEPEEWGVWTCGPHAALVLRLDAPPRGALEADIEAIALLVAARPAVAAQVLVNGVALADWTFRLGEPAAPRTLRLPAGLIGADGVVCLSLRNREPASPRSLGLSDDARELGLGLISLTLREAAPGVVQ